MLLLLWLPLCTGVAAAAVPVRHVLDGKTCWSLTGSFSFKHDLFHIYVPLGSTLAFTGSVRLCCILGSYGHSRSQGGRPWNAVFSQFFFCLTSCGFTTECLYRMTWYTRCCTVVRLVLYLACIYTHRVLLCSCRWSGPVLSLQQLLLFLVACRMANIIVG